MIILGHLFIKKITKIRKMIRIFITCFIALSLGVNAHADIKGSALNKISEKVSSNVSNLIPGEGLSLIHI